jgi:hypothetical protein
MEFVGCAVFVVVPRGLAPDGFFLRVLQGIKALGENVSMLISLYQSLVIGVNR